MSQLNTFYQPVNLDTEFHKMRKIKSQLLKMPNNKEKLLILKHYTNYYYFLIKICKKSEIPFKIFDFDWETLDKKYSRYYSNEAIQLKNILNEVKQIFSNARSINESYYILENYKLKKYIDPQTGKLLLDEFYHQLPDYINKHYKSIMNGNVYFSTQNNSGFAFDVSYCDESKIVCSGNKTDYDTYWSIAHEIGHCYHYHLLTGRKFAPSLDNEVPSIFMEIIFNRFVDAHLGKSDYGINSLFNRQTFFGYLLSREETFLSASDSFSFNDDYITRELSLRNLTNNGYQVLNNNLKNLTTNENQLTKQKEQIIYFRYIISNLIAIVIADIYEQDAKEGLKTLKDYLSLSHNVTMKEKIKLFNLTGDSYHRMITDISNYGIKKHILTSNK